MKKYICNPVNIHTLNKFNTAGRDPGFGFVGARMNVPHQGFGDPAVVRYKGRYFVFGSMADYWYSDDLVDWYPVKGAGKGFMPGAAGDGRVLGDYLYHSASSRESSYFSRTKDPVNGTWEKVSEPFGFWDPALYVDDDGKVYLYWGCHNVDPIWGIEMDPETLQPIGERVVLIEEDRAHHGFERNGWNNDPSIGMLREGETDAPGLIYDAPWIEGPYMTKHDGKYYLQYAGPATELPVYSDGCYVSDKPLGPFTYCNNSPFSTVRGGFYQGAGHGSTFEDEYGNYWHAASMIGAAQCSTRKMGLYPVGFDKDGIMYCDQNFADYPHIVPQEAAAPDSLFTGWMLLSYKKPVEASSSIESHPTKFITDESSRTYWAASVRRDGEWVKMDLEKVMDVRAVQLNFCDHDVRSLLGIPFNRFNVQEGDEVAVRHRWLLEGSVDGINWEVLCDKREAETDMIHDFIVFEEGKSVRYLRLTSYETPFFGNFAMTGFRVFGHEDGEKPAKAENVVIDRDKNDGCTVSISWDKAEGAVGYNVRWGIAPDKLYHSTLVYDDNTLLMHCLNDGVPYFIQVDSFSGCGITEGDIKAAQ